jgi:lariat debranching enzyme
MVTHRNQAHPQQINFLLKKKKHFRKDIEEGNLGARCLNQIANILKPKIWFSGHLHVKFNNKLKIFDNN